MSSYLDRKAATGFVRKLGIPTGDTALANLASDGKGPKYSIINGRALYKREDLLAWIDEQASAPPRARRSNIDSQQTAA
jgi:hypothetical protein